MTSKEALVTLKARQKCIDSKTYREMLTAIEKDLEMLEILKPLIKAQKVFLDNGAIKCNKEFQKELDKIKEWLKNDK